MIRIYAYSEVPKEEVFARTEPKTDVSGTVAAVIERVRTEGDNALRAFTEQFDRVKLENFEVAKAEREEALAAVDPDFVRILKRAAANIRKFHENQKREGFRITDENGTVMGQKVTPLDRVGLYVPGGTAAYPSTVLMNSIPAKIAGVREVVMVTPPGKDGKLNPAILAAASVAGIDRIVKIGGAQAVAALAYGTESIPKVDKIVGPGNAFVAEAKRQVFGEVAIDMIAGPSEILVVSDGNSDPKVIAADLLSQAEHDKNASAVLVTDSADFASAVQAEIEDQIPKLIRAEIARDSIDRNGKIIVAGSLMQAFEIANEIAPEHLEVATDDPMQYLDVIRHAGSVFLGRHTPEALGDYLAGPNHTLPTGGTARFSSPLSVDDFVKKTQFTYFTEEAFRDVAEDVAAFAKKEGLTGHAKSALVRIRKED